MATMKHTDAHEKLDRFLAMMMRLGQPGVIQIPPEKLASTVEAVTKSFKGALKLWEVPANAGGNEVLSRSVKKAETLLAVVRATSDPHALRLIEQIVEDGAIDTDKGSVRKPLKPVKAWNLLVIAEEYPGREPYFKSTESFPWKLRI